MNYEQKKRKRIFSNDKEKKITDYDEKFKKNCYKKRKNVMNKPSSHSICPRNKAHFGI